MTRAMDRLTDRSLERLLQRLGPERDAAAQEYEAIRRKLADFFDRRGAFPSDVLADEALDRVARKVDEGEALDHPRSYCYGVGRLVFLEWQKDQARQRASLAELPAAWAARDPPEMVEARIGCLEHCLEQLPAADRELILAYYQGPGRVHLQGRKGLAERLAMTYGTLKIRAHRIRTALEACLHRCLEERNQ